jgi:hypothetical protein
MSKPPVHIPRVLNKNTGTVVHLTTLHLCTGLFSNNLERTAVRIKLKNGLYMFPYKLQVVEVLGEYYKSRSVEFCNTFLRMPEEYDRLIGINHVRRSFFRAYNLSQKQKKILSKSTIDLYTANIVQCFVSFIGLDSVPCIFSYCQ